MPLSGWSIGGALVRRQIFATLTGQDADLALGGLSLLDGGRHADTTLVVDHAAPHGQSREFYKHIVADDATGVYQGKVDRAARRAKDRWRHEEPGDPAFAAGGHEQQAGA